MVEEDDRDIATYYGVWPTIVGFLLGAGMMVFMFALADGFTG